jgi:uncharacterized protein (DUF983 family)
VRSRPGRCSMSVDARAYIVFLKERSMAEKVPQSLANHTRFDPPFHFFILPVFAITVIVAIVNLVRYPSLQTAWLVVFTVQPLQP